MKDINGLIASLNVHLRWNKSRLTCFIQMILGLLAVRTVNMQEIALAFSSDAKISSRYRRLQRFFSFFKMDLTDIARWIFILFFNDNKNFYVIIDRTNWYWGKKKINVFMLSIAYEGLAIPIFWDLLNKAGSSNYSEQKELINRFVCTFGKKRIAGLLGDREFASGRLFRWFNRQKIPFYIRIKEGSQVHVKSKKYRTAKKLFNHLSCKNQAVFDMRIEVFNSSVFLAGARSERGELMIVATNQHPKNAIAIYLRRWEIESLFQSLKGRGFRFEETHLVDMERIKKLLAVLSIAFVWAHRVGEWRAVKKAIFQKQFKKNQRPQYSYFRYGLDFIRNILFQSQNKMSQVTEFIKIPYLTPLGETLS